ncbi:MAG: thiamine pyrophosphate-binding protein [Solirubrobacterales bacterium]|nr:thiamine pyrophosphate-binding protein [Solirubrobacterales bacterium]
MSRETLFGRIAPNGAERTVARLKAHGVSLVISIPGSQVLPLWDAVDRTEGVRLLVPRSERSGAVIAEGYGLAKGVPAVVANTLGPGVANEAVAVASARLSEAPVLYLAPNQPPNKRPRIEEVFQGLDHAAFMEGSAMEQFACDDSQGLEASIDAALAASLGEPSGPVRLDVSFPIFFSRSARRSAAPLRRLPARPPQVGKGAELLLGLESSAVADGHLLNAAGLAGDAAVHPGVDTPGLGLSFALGLRLGRTRAPVAIVTDEESLLGQLEVLILAQQAGVKVSLAGLGVGPDASQRLRRIADQTGAAWLPIDSDTSPADVRGAILERQKGLTVIVG